MAEQTNDTDVADVKDVKDVKVAFAASDNQVRPSEKFWTTTQV